jgi:transcriptional regulator with XRE-family HTH domain
MNRVPRNSPLREVQVAERANAVGSVSEALGARIRLERKLAGVTVRGLASQTGVSPSLISQIERGLAMPSVSTLWSIATELGLSIAELFNGVESVSVPRNHSPIQPHETRKAITLAGGVRWERLTTTSDEEADFVYVVYPVGAASCEENALNRHGGREFGYVISGTLGVKIGFNDYVVRANDSISFESSTPHRLWTIGNKPVRAIWMVINRRGDDRSKSFK